MHLEDANSIKEKNSTKFYIATHLYPLKCMYSPFWLQICAVSHCYWWLMRCCNNFFVSISFSYFLNGDLLRGMWSVQHWWTRQKAKAPVLYYPVLSGSKHSFVEYMKPYPSSKHNLQLGIFVKDIMYARCVTWLVINTIILFFHTKIALIVVT